ncbi:MAG: PAAR domain-containing protein [Gaiellales bacterium]
MGAPAALLGDPITGVCPVHVGIGPLGAPVPLPGLPFQAPLVTGSSVRTTINGRPIMLVGATGFNTPPHVGLHPSDPCLVPPMQIGTVVASPATVLVEGLPVAVTGASCTMCNQAPGTLAGSSNVLVG